MAKAICKLCATEGQTTGTCTHCGKTLSDAMANFIYGKVEKESFASECILTDKYLIVRRVTKKEMVGSTVAVAAGGAILGAVGALASGAANAAVAKTRKMCFGFYDLKEIDKVIFPYNAKGIKTDTAFKFINKDGSDFILHFNLNGMFCKKAAKAFAKALKTTEVKIEEGSSEKQPECCSKPFVNADNFYLRVAHSAGEFVHLAQGQFVAPPCLPGSYSGVLTEPAPKEEPEKLSKKKEKKAATTQTATDVAEPVVVSAPIVTTPTPVEPTPIAATPVPEAPTPVVTTTTPVVPTPVVTAPTPVAPTPVVTTTTPVVSTPIVTTPTPEAPTPVVTTPTPVVSTPVVTTTTPEAPTPVVTTPASVNPEAEAPKPFKFCYKCGTPAYVADQLFCAECGVRLL